MRKLKLQKEWSFLASLPKNEKLLEKGAVFVSQWCQPDQYIEYEAISQQLDDIAFAVSLINLYFNWDILYFCNLLKMCTFF